MARLPSEQYLIQQIGGNVILFREGSGHEIVRIPVLVPESDADDAPLKVNTDGFAKAQKTIHDSDLSEEDKSFAHFWSGYFYAWAGDGTLPEARS
jgi:hypothetical protein